MSRRVRLSSMDRGRYMTTVDGVHYEAVRVSETEWELYRLAGDARDLIQEGPTLCALRNHLEELAGPQPEPTRSDLLCLELERLNELHGLLSLSLIESRKLDAMDLGLFVGQPIEIARRAVAVALSRVTRRSDEVLDELAEAERIENDGAEQMTLVGQEAGA